MKKYGLLFCTIFLCSAMFSQEKLIYNEVVEVPGKTKDQLYDQAKQWFIEIYKDASEVIQNDDKENGTISGKALMKYTSNIFIGNDATKGVISYTIQIHFKDGKYKYEISNFIHDGEMYNFGSITTDEECPYVIPGGTKNWNNKVWKDIKSQIESYSDNLITSLKESMKNELSNDDW